MTSVSSSKSRGSLDSPVDSPVALIRDGYLFATPGFLLFCRKSLTRHQFYLQLRKDLLEGRLLCSDEIALQLGALALQAEMGTYALKV